MRLRLYGCLCLLLPMAGCGDARPLVQTAGSAAPPAAAPIAADPLALVLPARTASDRILNRAKEEARREVLYDARYVRLPYPGGDVSADRGACMDVVVRSLRAAGIDLQQRIHEDMAAHYDRYPHRWEPRHPDPNIDHRRAPNHITYFRRYGKALPTGLTGAALASWQPGDFVYWKLNNGLDHCGVISDIRNTQGVPLVIHNIGVARQEDCLAAWKIVAHFRYPAQ